MDNFWQSEEWYAYERATGDEAGTRDRLLKRATWSTRVVDLSFSLEKLRVNTRKSYRHIAQKWLRAPGQEVRFFCRSQRIDGHLTPTQRCRHLHRCVAGRETRSQESWDIQDQWEAQGTGIVALATRSAPQDAGFQDIGYAYIVRRGEWAYYFSAASLEKNVGHALQYALMPYLQVIGVRWYEVGWQGQAQTEKEKSIEFFRSGWGGVDVQFEREKP